MTQKKKLTSILQVYLTHIVLHIKLYNWILDSDATDHMTPVASKLSQRKHGSDRSCVKLPIGQITSTDKVGDIY